MATVHGHISAHIHEAMCECVYLYSTELELLPFLSKVWIKIPQMEDIDMHT